MKQKLFSGLLLVGFIFLFLGFIYIQDRCGESSEALVEPVPFLEQNDSGPLPFKEVENEFSTPSKSRGEPHSYETFAADSNCDTGRWLLNTGTFNDTEKEMYLDPQSCMDVVLKTQGCSKDWFVHSIIDGNCRCIDEGVDCTDPKVFRVHEGVKTYRIRYEPWEHKSPRILYVIRTYPRTYKTRMRWLSDTWLSTIEDPILIVGITNSFWPDHAKLDIPMRDNMKVIYPKCHRKGKGEGICCQEAYGLVEALKYEFDWLHMIDDDVFISPTNIKNMLDQTHDYFDGRGGFGCSLSGTHYEDKKVKLEGFCGGMGYAFRRNAIEQLVWNQGAFLHEYKTLCQEFQACDVVTGVLANRRGLNIMRASMARGPKHPEQSVYHRVYGDKQYKLHKMINLKTEPFSSVYALSNDWKNYVHSWDACKTECTASEADEKWD